MLDKTSKKVIEYIRCFKDATWHYNQGYHYDLPYDEFILCLYYLHEQGYLSLKQASGRIVSATLTHKGLHAKEFNMIALERYALDKWIDLLTAVIALAALVLSIIALLR